MGRYAVETGVIAMFRRQRATTGRHRRTGTGPASPPDLVPGRAPVEIVDTARARLDPVTCPIPLLLPGARLRPPERRLIRTA